MNWLTLVSGERRRGDLGNEHDPAPPANAFPYRHRERADLEPLGARIQEGIEAALRRHQSRKEV